MNNEQKKACVNMSQNSTDVIYGAPQCSRKNPFSIIETCISEGIKTKKLPLKSMQCKIDDLSKEEFKMLLEEYAAYLQKCKNEGGEKTKEYNLALEIIVDNEFCFKRQYISNIFELYPIIYRMNQLADFTGSPLFSQDPNHAVYGAVRQVGNNNLYRRPLEDETLQMLIQAVAEYSKTTGNGYQLGKWLFTILSFNKSKFTFQSSSSDMIQFEGNGERMRKKIKQEMTGNEYYQQALTYYMLSENIIENMVKKDIIANGEKEQNKNLEQQLAQAKLEKGDLEIELSNLQRQLENLQHIEKQQQEREEKCRELSEKYDRQISINKALSRDNESQQILLKNKLEELESEIDEKVLENKRVLEQISYNEEKLELLTREKENISADLLNERNKVEILRNGIDQKITEAREELLKGMIFKLNDPLNHFSRYFEYFQSLNGIDVDTISFCMDDLNNIIEIFKEYNLLPIGRYLQEVKYDYSIHHCEDTIKIGEKAKIIAVGWQVGENVVVKAEVEKTEEDNDEY